MRFDCQGLLSFELELESLHLKFELLISYLKPIYPTFVLFLELSLQLGNLAFKFFSKFSTFQLIESPIGSEIFIQPFNLKFSIGKCYLKFLIVQLLQLFFDVFLGLVCEFGRFVWTHRSMVVWFVSLAELFVTFFGC